MSKGVKLITVLLGIVVLGEISYLFYLKRGPIKSVQTSVSNLTPTSAATENNASTQYKGKVTSVQYANDKAYLFELYYLDENDEERHLFFNTDDLEKTTVFYINSADGNRSPSTIDDLQVGDTITAIVEDNNAGDNSLDSGGNMVIDEITIEYSR